MGVVGQHKKLKPDSFNHRHKEENCKGGETVNSQSPALVMYFLPQDPFSKSSMIRTTN